jgi:SAM-dependent methyltransferase
MAATPTPALFGASAEKYERQMGRFSRQLARPFAQFAGVGDGERLLDVGCGTGSLTFTLREMAPRAKIVAVDMAETFLSFARARAGDANITFQQADACALPFPEASFDRVLSLLVLHFIPDSRRVVGEFRRVVRPGGVAAACVWDNFGGMPHFRMVFDTAAALGLDQERTLLRPLTAPGQLEAAWSAGGFVDVQASTLHARFEYQSFDDYWSSVASGEGPTGQMIESQSPADRERLRERVRHVYLSNKPDGVRSFAGTAWVCRGTRPPASGG